MMLRIFNKEGLAQSASKHFNMENVYFFNLEQVEDILGQIIINKTYNPLYCTSLCGLTTQLTYYLGSILQPLNRLWSHQKI